MKFREILGEEMRDFDSLIENIVPRSFENYNAGNLRWNLDINALDEALANPIWDLLSRGGKRWRPFLMKLCFETICKDSSVVDRDLLEKLLPLPEIIHNGTLMIDDIEDCSDLRRGKDCIHKIFGNDIAINAGNIMYFLPIMKVFDSNLPNEKKIKVLKIINEEMIKLHLGQGLDISWHSGNGMPSENEYLQMCAFKTGTLARMAAKLGGVLGGASDDTVLALGEFAESLGVAFQIQDDILNICVSENLGKEFGDDISEGKRTLILIRALNSLSKNDSKDLLGILNLKTKNKVLISEALRIFKKSDSIEYSKNIAKDLVKEAWEKLDEVLEESEAKVKLKGFADFVAERDL